MYDNDNIEYENEPDEEQTEQENNSEYGNEIESQIPEHGDIETEPSKAEDNSNDFENEMNERYGVSSENYNLHPSRHPRDYSHWQTTLESIIMTQHSMKKGIKLFREAGKDAVMQEL